MGMKVDGAKVALGIKVAEGAKVLVGDSRQTAHVLLHAEEEDRPAPG